MAHQRVPLCGARRAEMVPQGVWQHHVRGLPDVVRRDQRPAVAVQPDGGGCVRPCSAGPSGTADHRHAAVAGLQVEGDCGADGDDTVGHLAEVQEAEGAGHRAVLQEELRHGPRYAGGDGRVGHPAPGGYDGRGLYACTVFGREGKYGFRGNKIWKRTIWKKENKICYGEETYNTRENHGAAAERDLCVRQQPEGYARRWCGLYRLPQVRGHHGSGRGSAGSELRHPDDAGWRRDHPSVCGRVHRVCQGEQEPDVPCDSHRLRHCRIHRRRYFSAVREGSRRGEYRAASRMVKRYGGYHNRYIRPL